MSESMTQIHPTAIVEQTVELGEGVIVGAYSIIRGEVKIGDRTRVEPHVVIEGHTTIGEDNVFHPGSVIGGPPQDYGYKGEVSFVKIGNKNILRECVTIHRASGEGEATIVGDANMLMAYCHVGHNCILGSHITMANTVGISGHTIIEDNVVFGGMTGVHQKLRVGKLAMVGGFSKIVQDIPPFSMVDGRPGKVLDINVVGLRRNNIPTKSRTDIRKAYKILYRSDLNVSQALERIEKELEITPEISYLIEFIKKIRLGTRGRQLETPRL